MRSSVLIALTFGLLTAAAAAPEKAPSAHPITCASAKVERDYRDGLRDLYLGRVEQALAEFKSAAKRDPQCAMAWWAQSRAELKAGRTAEARAASAKAEELAPFADDREQKFIAAWAKWVKAGEDTAARNSARQAVQRDLDLALCLYPDDPELWVFRAEMAESPVRANPFFLTAFRIEPDHPLAAGWKPTVLPVPTPAPAGERGATTNPNPLPALNPPPKLFEGLGRLSHPITTRSQEAQAYYEQGLRCLHSYVTPMRVANSAGRCFQYAAQLDPEAPMPYWGLSFCVGNSDALKPLRAAQRALELALKNGSDKEKRFCAARVLELQNKHEEFKDALDSAIGAYPEDVELWIWRGTYLYTARGPSRGQTAAGIVFQQAAHRLRPEHPAPNHEMVHGYEALDRPALGWPYTEGYRRSAPNMPHANHMQAHLATRLGRWDEAIDCTRMSRKKSLEGFPELDPSHHIDIMIRALAHQGRFKEAEAEPKAYRDGLPWARLLQLKADPAELDAWAARRRERNAPDGFYIGAIAKLDLGDTAAALPLIQRVEADFNKNKAPANMYRFHEVKGRYLVQTGEDVEGGLKLLQQAGARAVKDPGLHAWGGGSYVLEVWGETALRARRWDDAEEAFLEALAHEHYSIIGALGMQVVWEARGRQDRARHYAERAAAIWKGADPGYAERHLERLRKIAQVSVARRGTR